MQRLIALVLCGTLFSSCVLIRYNELEFGVTSHQDVMNTKFKSKEDVFKEFGVSDKKDVLKETEVWSYKLNTVSYTNSNSTGSSVYRKRSRISGPLVLGSSTTSLSTLSTTNVTQNYVTFWFVNDSIIKWESVGLDLSQTYPNQNYDPVKAKKFKIYNFLTNLAVTGMFFFIFTAGG